MTTHSVVINYDYSIEDSIKAGNYNKKNKNITSKNFPSQESGTKEVTIKIFYYGHGMRTHEVLTDLDRKGYRAATLKELLALGKKYPALKRIPIVALNSVYQNSSGRRYYPYFYRDDSVLDLDLETGKWGCIDRFAVVPK